MGIRWLSAVRSGCGLAAGLLVLMGAVLPLSALATGPEPHVPELPLRPQGVPPAVGETASDVATLSLPPLKAVLLVGPIDGDYGSWTNDEKANMDLAAAELVANGVSVHKFYAPNTDWDEIKAAANGAQFLLYRGHGVYWGPMPTPPVGGFALSNGANDYRFVSSDQIRSDLKLAPNAIVMLYGCFTAGTSSNDPSPISSAEAKRRVAQYSDPFFDIGAAGYFADWYGNAFQMFIRYLFQGKTQAQVYESFYDFNAATVERYTHPDHPEMAMWLDKDYWGEVQYNYAFSGRPDATLADLFVPTAMAVLPGPFFRLAEPTFGAQRVDILITSTTSTTFSWTSVITPSVEWLSMSPTTGTSGQVATVDITPTGMATGTYLTTLNLWATPAHTDTLEDDHQVITVTLHVVDKIHSVHLPVVLEQ